MACADAHSKLVELTTCLARAVVELPSDAVPLYQFINTASKDDDADTDSSHYHKSLFHLYVELCELLGMKNETTASGFFRTVSKVPGLGIHRKSFKTHFFWRHPDQPEVVHTSKAAHFGACHLRQVLTSADQQHIQRELADFIRREPRVLPKVLGFLDTIHREFKPISRETARAISRKSSKLPGNPGSSLLAPTTYAKAPTVLAGPAVTERALSNPAYKPPRIFPAEQATYIGPIPISLYTSAAKGSGCRLILPNTPHWNQRISTSLLQARVTSTNVDGTPLATITCNVDSHRLVTIAELSTEDALQFRKSSTSTSDATTCFCLVIGCLVSSVQPTAPLAASYSNIEDESSRLGLRSPTIATMPAATSTPAQATAPMLETVPPPAPIITQQQAAEHYSGLAPGSADFDPFFNSCSNMTPQQLTQLDAFCLAVENGVRGQQYRSANAKRAFARFLQREPVVVATAKVISFPPMAEPLTQPPPLTAAPPPVTLVPHLCAQLSSHMLHQPRVFERFPWHRDNAARELIEHLLSCEDAPSTREILMRAAFAVASALELPTDHVHAVELYLTQFDGAGGSAVTACQILPDWRPVRHAFLGALLAAAERAGSYDDREIDVTTDLTETFATHACDADKCMHIDPDVSPKRRRSVNENDIENNCGGAPRQRQANAGTTHGSILSPIVGVGDARL